MLRSSARGDYYFKMLKFEYLKMLKTTRELMKNYVICVICFVLVFWARVDVGTSLGGGDCGMWGESEAVHRYCIE